MAQEWAKPENSFVEELETKANFISKTTNNNQN